MEAHTLARRRFTVDDYHRMAEAGILHEDDRVELIDGEIVEMTPIGGRHMAAVNALTRLLVLAAAEAHPEAEVSVQNPVRLGARDEPEPDLAVLGPRRGDHAREVPDASDVLFLVEVAETSLTYDRRTKLPLYARAGVAEVWIVDLPAQTIERHTRPEGGAYRSTVTAKPGERLASEVVPGLALDAVAVIF